MLTKKHFEAIADILNKHYSIEEPASIRGRETRAIIDLIACDLGDYFEGENERFDLERFLNRFRGVRN